jgi:hypothetical protein
MSDEREVLAVCSVDGCTRSRAQNGNKECQTHARRRRATGDYGGPISEQRPRGLGPWESVEWYGWTVTESGCWEFDGNRTGDGYGSVYIEGSMRPAHRISYEHHHGLLGGLLVRHKCDNPPCVNPDHLEPGTNAENMADMVARGRSSRGESNPKARLTEAQVASIKARPTATVATLAREYGVGETAIRKIRNGQTWGWVSPAEEARS